MTDQLEFRKDVIGPVECYREAWEIIKPHYWMLFALTIVGVMISGASLYVLGGAMICGIMFSFLGVVE
ncbi:MAG: hypothetical protein OEQ28_05880, partial [Acidobacteriota bacterium]|nr:hypothetical protein [Acidobacteriota bacterium]